VTKPSAAALVVAVLLAPAVSGAPPAARRLSRAPMSGHPKHNVHADDIEAVVYGEEPR